MICKNMIMAEQKSPYLTVATAAVAAVDIVPTASAVVVVGAAALVTAVVNADASAVATIAAIIAVVPSSLLPWKRFHYRC